MEHESLLSPEASFIIPLGPEEPLPSPERAGNKAANLARVMHMGLPVPAAFVLSTGALSFFLERNRIRRRVNRLMRTALAGTEGGLIDGIANEIQGLIRDSSIPEELAAQISAACGRLRDVSAAKELAVRSSGTVEDSPTASYAGVFQTVVNVAGDDEIFEAVKTCWAGLYSSRVIRYVAGQEGGRTQEEGPGRGLAGMGLAVLIQVMVPAKMSGLVFTEDPAGGDPDHMLVDVVYGLGEQAVSGAKTPVTYVLLKSSGDILEVRGRRVQRAADVAVMSAVEHLRKLAVSIEQEIEGPLDIEWAGTGAEVFVLQVRPLIMETGKEEPLSPSMFFKPGERVVLAGGVGVSPRVGKGRAVVLGESEPAGVEKTDVVVVRRLTNDVVVGLKHVAAVVAEEGGSTSHGANILREFGVPCIVGARRATTAIQSGCVVTVDGWRGLVYEGDVMPEQVESGREVTVTRMKVMVSIQDPETAFSLAPHADGVSSLRNDYLILQSGVHPAVLAREGRSNEVRARLAEAMKTVCRAFMGKKVWYKTLDAPTDEFRRLRGGETEPVERNPLLGWRGIARELDEVHLLKMEFGALADALEAGCSNLAVKIPFLRTVDEFDAALEVARAAGVEPGHGIQVGVSLETPSAVLSAERLVESGARFFSIGINDLTMCTLAIDRESEKMARLFDPVHPAVVKLLEEAVAVAREVGVFVAVCGDVAHPALIRRLSEMGVDAVGAAPVYLDRIRRMVAEVEGG